MPFQSVSCPYCNAPVSVPARVDAAQRIPCPRCGESFAYRSSEEIQAGPGVPANGLYQLPSNRDFPDVQRRWRNSTVARVVLAVMIGMGLIGLSYALLTVSWRRANDRRNADAPEVKPVRPVSPVRLAGLGYLPDDVNVAAGLHVAELLEHEAGRKMLDRFRLGPTDFTLAHLEQVTGLDRKDMDHLVVGVRLEGVLLPGVLVVVQTRRPYDEAKVRRALQAKPPEQVHNRTVYPVNLGKLDGRLWFASRDLLVLGLVLSDIKAVPARPVSAGERPELPLFDAMRGRMAPGTQAWIAGHSKDWEQTVLRFLPKDPDKADRNLLVNVRTFGIGWQFGDGMIVKADVDCATPEAARTLRDTLNRRAAEGTDPLNFLQPGRGADPLSRTLAQNLKCMHAPGDTWVAAITRADPETLEKALQPAQ